MAKPAPLGETAERGMHRRAQRWTTIGLAALALALGGTARADERPVALHYGPAGPFAELLGAGLGLVGLDLREGPLPAPVGQAEAEALFRETGAVAIVDHHQGLASLWIRRGGAIQRAEVQVADDPGIAPLIIAETLRTAMPARQPPAATPPSEPDWTPPPPRLASEPVPPTDAPDPEAPSPSLTLSAAPLAVYGGRWTGGVALEAALRLHPALSLGASASLSGFPAAAAFLRVDGRVGPLGLSLDAGPAVWWREQPDNDGSVRLRPSPSWTAGVGASVELSARWALGARVGLLRAGPRHRVGDQEAALTLSFGLGARF